MTFDVSKVYTAVNADELKVGSKVIVADDLSSLKTRVNCEKDWVFTLKRIWGTSNRDRFEVSTGGRFTLCYLISEPEEKKMTLKEKAEEYFENNCEHSYADNEEQLKEDVVKVYIAGKEETEKELADKLLDNWCRNKDDYCPHLKALEAQIEKIKRCDMCKYSSRLGYCKIRQQGGVCVNRNKWEIKEND